MTQNTDIDLTTYEGLKDLELQALTIRKQITDLRDSMNAITLSDPDGVFSQISPPKNPATAEEVARATDLYRALGPAVEAMQAVVELTETMTQRQMRADGYTEW